MSASNIKNDGSTSIPRETLIEQVPCWRLVIQVVYRAKALSHGVAQ